MILMQLRKRMRSLYIQELLNLELSWRLKRSKVLQETIVFVKCNLDNGYGQGLCKQVAEIEQDGIYYVMIYKYTKEVRRILESA